MITYEQDSDTYYDIGTKDEIINELFNRLNAYTETAYKKQRNFDADLVYDTSEVARVMRDIFDNADNHSLIAITTDTPSGNLGWTIVEDITLKEIDW